MMRELGFVVLPGAWLDPAPFDADAEDTLPRPPFVRVGRRSGGQLVLDVEDDASAQVRGEAAVLGGFRIDHIECARDVPDGTRLFAVDTPDYWDFVYFSFVAGMTFQVSDVQVESRLLRRLVVAYGALAFSSTRGSSRARRGRRR
jgi:hypothetical protein